MSQPNKNADTPGSTFRRSDEDLADSLHRALADSSSVSPSLHSSIRSTFPPLVDLQQQRAEDRAHLAGLSEKELREHKRQKLLNILQAAIDVVNDVNNEDSTSASVEQSNQTLKGKHGSQEPRN
jgi:hypothetical protein